VWFPNETYQISDYYLLKIVWVKVSMAFPRSLTLGMHSDRTHLQSGQPFHVHPGSDYNRGYLQPSLYWDVGSGKDAQTSLLQQAGRGSLIRQLVRIRLLVLIIILACLQSLVLSQRAWTFLCTHTWIADFTAMCETRKAGCGPIYNSCLACLSSTYSFVPNF